MGRLEQQHMLVIEDKKSWQCIKTNDFLTSLKLI